MLSVYEHTPQAVQWAVKYRVRQVFEWAIAIMWSVTDLVPAVVV